METKLAVIDGVEVSPPALVGGLWTTAVLGDDQVAVLRAKDEKVARHAYKPLRAVPEGYTVMPSLPGLGPEQAEAVLQELGLRAVIVDVDSDAPVGSVVGTNPPIPAVVKVGQHVEVLRSTAR